MEGTLNTLRSILFLKDPSALVAITMQEYHVIGV